MGKGSRCFSVISIYRPHQRAPWDMARHDSCLQCFWSRLHSLPPLSSPSHTAFFCLVPCFVDLTILIFIICSAFLRLCFHSCKIKPCKPRQRAWRKKEEEKRENTREGNQWRSEARRLDQRATVADDESDKRAQSLPCK